MELNVRIHDYIYKYTPNKQTERVIQETPVVGSDEISGDVLVKDRVTTQLILQEVN